MLISVVIRSVFYFYFLWYSFKKMAVRNDHWDMFRYDDQMRKVLDDSRMKKKLAAFKRMQIENIKVDLAEFSANVQGLDRALQKRLFRAWYKKTKISEENENFTLFERRVLRSGR